MLRSISLENSPRATARGETAADHPALWVLAAILVVAVALAYANGVSAPFVYDDGPAILANPSIRRLSDLGAVFSPPPHLTTSGRPIANLTLALDYAVGGTSVTSYHLTNLAIHLACGLLLFGLVRRTLLAAPLRSRFGADARYLAWLVAGLWLLHPLATEAVTYVVQRTESLVAFFYLFAWYAFVRGADSGSKRWLFGGIAACFLGMATKEVMASAPLVVFAYDRTFLAGSWREAWRRRARWYVLLATSWVVLAWAVVSAGGTRDGSAGFGQGMSAAAYALTQIPALVHYLCLSAWPHPLVFDYGRALVAPSFALVPAALLVAAGVVATGIGVVRGSVVGFVGLACAAVLAPSSSVVPVVTETVAEHRMYLPLAGAIAVGVGVAYRLGGRRGLALALVAAVALGSLTHRRNADYATAETLWAGTVAKAPQNPRAHNQLGFQLAERGAAAAALAEYRAAICAAPNDADARFNVATALMRTGRLAEALPEFAVTIRLRSDFADAHCNLGWSLVQLGRTEEAEREYFTALRLDPENAVARNNVGIVLAQTGRLPAAIVQFEKAVRSQPSYAEAHNNLGHAYVDTGRLGDAVREFDSALRIAPDYAEAHDNLGRALDQLGESERAATEFAAVVRLAPRYAEAHYRLANDCARLGRGAAAVREWRETVRLEPNHVLARDALMRYGQSADRAD